MNVDRFIFAFAGILILLGILLSHYQHPNWLWLSGVISANIIQASITGFCPLAMLLKRLGVKSGMAFN